MNAARPRKLLTIVVLATIVTGCRSAATPPDTVVDPAVTGRWISEEVVGSTWRITLDTGRIVDIDPGHMQLAIANTIDRKERTIIMVGKGPRVDWYVLLNPADGYPTGCFPVQALAYEIRDSIVFRARPDAAPYGLEADFGIRFRKAPKLESPPDRYAPWYGNSVTLCVSSDGMVTEVAPPSGP